MRFASVGELRKDTSRVLRAAAEGQPVVVTSRGRPVALLTQVAEDDLEDLALQHNLGLGGCMRRAVAEARGGKALTADEIRSRRRNKSKPGRNPRGSANP